MTDHSSDIKSEAPRPWLPGMALLELALFFVSAFVIDIVWLDGDRFSQMQPHPFWIIVLLLSVQYGTIAGLFAALASTIALLWGQIPAQRMDQDLYEWLISVSRLPLLWSITALVLGELSMRAMRKQRQLQKSLKEALEHEATLTESVQKLNSLREKLEVRVAGQWRTAGQALRVARDLQYLDPQEVPDGALNLIDALFEPECCSLYLYRDNHLHLKTSRGKETCQTPRHEYKPGHALLTTLIGERRVLCVADPHDEVLLDGEGLIAAPILTPDNEEVIGMIKIEAMGFARLSTSTIENLRFACDWIGAIYDQFLNQPVKRKPS